MLGKNRVKSALRCLLTSRRGTAEIIGSVMFLLIILFFFTNVFLWHDNATREMDGALSDKVNSLVSIRLDGANLVVTNNGGVDVALSRLWVNDRNGHWYADFEVDNDEELWVAAGYTKTIWLNMTSRSFDGQSIEVTWDDEGNALVHYSYYSYGGSVTFKILTSRGNSAACQYKP